MRRTSTFRATLCTVALTVVAAASLAAMVTDSPGDQLVSPSAGPTSPCSAIPSKNAAPVEATLGEPVTITMHVKALCRGFNQNYHIAFVLDGSATMSPPSLRQIKETATYVVQGLRMTHGGSTRVGVVEFGAVSQSLCQLTSNERQALNCINRVGRRGDADVGAGILEGVRVLKKGRGHFERAFMTEVMIVMSDGHFDDCASAVSAKRQAQRDGILMIAVCGGRDCNSRCMRQVAAGSRYFFEADQQEQLREVLERIGHRHYSVNIRRLTVRDTLSEHVSYVPDSARPGQTSPAMVERSLTWEVDYVPREGATFTLRVRPVSTGEIPTNAGASGTLLDNLGRSVEFTFDGPTITVREDTATPVASGTPVPSVTPTSTAAPLETVTPAARQSGVFVPMAWRD